MSTRYKIASAVAMASPKAPERNQDRAQPFVLNSGLDGAGVVVCDGVGARARSGEVAELVVRAACGYVERNGVGDDFAGCLDHVAELSTDIDGATTLIAIAATEAGRVSYALVGNGSLFEVEAYDQGDKGPRLGWVQLVLPQVSFATGVPALRSFLPAPNVSAVEALLGSRSRNAATARLYLACTDGVSTEEERVVAETADGRRWVELDRPLATVLEALEASWSDLAASDTPPELLGEVLQAALDRSLDEGMLDDDATLGSVLLRPGEQGPS